MSKQALFGELRQGKRPRCKPKQRYKDCLKDTLKKVRIDIDTWEDLAKDRGKWISVILNGVKDFEERSRGYAEVKRAAKYMKEVMPLPGKGSKEELTCDYCGRICLSRAGLMSHERRHLSDDSTLQYDIQLDFSCSLCNKVCSSASGLTRRHKTSHPDQLVAW